jgi:UTP:GlnB (protein PII) uridylyltransferase
LSSLHQQVVLERAFLIEARDKAKVLHASGAAGFQVCSAWTDDVDDAVKRLIAAALEDLGAAPDPSSYAFVALGGYGRRDLGSVLRHRPHAAVSMY